MVWVYLGLAVVGVFTLMSVSISLQKLLDTQTSLHTLTIELTEAAQCIRRAVEGVDRRDAARQDKVDAEEFRLRRQQEYYDVALGTKEA
jgi:hypothetical protein